MSHKSRGISRERELVNRLRAEGKFAMRAPASLGVDIVELDDGTVRFWEVKATAGGPYERFSRAARAAFIAYAEQHGAEAWLCWHPYDRNGPRFIPARAWPKL